MAEYMTRSQLKQLDLKVSTVERDVTFMALKPPSRPGKDDSGDISVKLTLLTPQRAAQILSNTVPPVLIFYRPPIAAAQPGKALPRPGAAVSSAAADLAAASEPPSSLEPTGIYGSVSTADVATSIRALLATDEEGSRVVISPEEIIFLNSISEEDELGDVDRVKRLGDFEVEIKVKGMKDSLKKTVRVLPEQKEVNFKLEDAREK
ncbi:hypothetical protein GP486_003063 [Trichoglossum hirsutum]|uniref:Ribosomal protein L9 domain-containing protein n=1 Tax=Trichoglossum hirsutum TaxID=265104 RepID=A0A9P8RRI0_9PEZI|nr:hypothetical protein GP486_003063 [Trichoglossum hirsutum]